MNQDPWWLAFTSSLSAVISLPDIERICQEYCLIMNHMLVLFHVVFLRTFCAFPSEVMVMFQLMNDFLITLTANSNGSFDQVFWFVCLIVITYDKNVFENNPTVLPGLIWEILTSLSFVTISNLRSHCNYPLHIELDDHVPKVLQI